MIPFDFTSTIFSCSVLRFYYILLIACLQFVSFLLAAMFSLGLVLLLLLIIILVGSNGSSLAFIPLLDGGKMMPTLYDGWFNEQIVKQARTAVSKAISSGKVGVTEGVSC